MKETAKTWCEFGKSATDVVSTARRKGYKCPSVEEAEASDVWDVPFEMAFSRRELIEQKNVFKDENHLTYVKILRGEFIEMDSLNMSHAGAYYRVEVELLKDEAVAAGLVEA